MESPRRPARVWVAAPPARSPFGTHIDEWAHGRNWSVRLPLLVYFALVLRNHLANPFYNSLVGGLNLGVHELGHFLWLPFGEFWAILGGSLTQCLVPIVVGASFYRQRDYFAIAIALCWLSTNLFYVGMYAADGLTQQLELVSPVGGDPMHDWGYLLGRWEMMSKARQVGAAFRMAATLAMLGGLLSGGWLLWRMRASTRARPEAPV